MRSTIVPPEFTTSIVPDGTISIAPFGGPGSGKTRLFCTAPGRVGILSLDKKTRVTVQKWRLEHPKDMDKFVMPKKDFIRETNLDIDTMPEANQIHYYRKIVDEMKAAVKTMARMDDVRTICIDTGTVLFRSMYFAHFARSSRIIPRDRGAVYQEFEDFINSFQHKNLIIAHQPKDIWENDKDTGQKGPDGYKKLGHLVDTVIEMRVSRVKKLGSGKYIVRVSQSQSAPELEGQTILTDNEISFPALAMQIRPDSNPGDWL